MPIEQVTKGGWDQCHSELYTNDLNDSRLTIIEHSCYFDKVMMACRKLGETMLKVLAWADRRTVFGATDHPDCKEKCLGNVTQGTKWYRTTIGNFDGAWGFAGGHDYIWLYPADEADQHIPSQNNTGKSRLSYHVNIGGLGGYRCGENIDLNIDSRWERLFFHAN